ncbi:unnamed protein product, partial [Ranitomeya imitator]
ESRGLGARPEDPSHLVDEGELLITLNLVYPVVFHKVLLFKLEYFMCDASFLIMSSTEDQSSHSGPETEVPQREEELIDNDLFIPLVQERVALWDTREQQHSDAVVIRWLWNEVAQALMYDWDNATSRVRKAFLIKVKTRWHSMKDHFSKDLRQEIQVRIGSAARIGKYKFHRVLSFLRPVLAQRTSTLKPGSSSGVVPQRTATDQSQLSTSEAASGSASQSGEQAAGPLDVPLSQSSATFLGGSSRQRQKASDRSPELGLPEWGNDLNHIFNPFLTSDGIHKTYKPYETFMVLGSQRLTELRDAINCVSDLQIGGEFSNNPDLAPENVCKDLFKSAFFFFEGIFYNDMRYPECRDISRTTIEWSESRDRGYGKFQATKMEDFTFNDLNIKIGFPYMYCHQGDCEHIVTFTDIRLIHHEDCLDRRRYPMHVRKHWFWTRKCNVCKVYVAKWVTNQDSLAPDDPCFFCDVCFRMLHYDTEGNKLGDFVAYAYVDTGTFN